MSKLLFIIIILSFSVKAINYTNDIYQIESIINRSIAVVGDENEEIGKGVSSGTDITGDFIPEMAAVAVNGVKVLYGTTNLVSRHISCNSSNSFFFERPSHIVYYDVPFIPCTGTRKGIGVVTSGPTITNQGIPVAQVVMIRAAPQFEPVTNYTQINGTNGFRIVGTSNATYIAFDITSCKDMNGDGLGEFVHHRFNSYVWYGNTNIGPNILYVDEINGTNGMVITERYGQGAGSGDFNGDGRGDIAVNTLAGLSLIYGRQRYVKTLSATNLSPEDGVTIKNATVRKNGGFGDINGDGIDDILMGATVLYGRTNWGTNPDAATMGFGEKMTPTTAYSQVSYSSYPNSPTAVIGDLNGDGYDDWAMQATFILQIAPPEETNMTLVIYGRPIYPEKINLWLPNGTNGFAIRGTKEVDPWEHTTSFWDPIRSFTRGGDWDNDGYEEAIFGMPRYGYTPSTNNEGVVTVTPGGPSPAWSPYIFTPELIMEGRSNMFASTVLTNIVTGRKGKRHMVLSDGPEPIEQEWLGTWFTTRVIRTTIDETRTVNYWTTNILGRSKPATTLVINAVPEPGMITAAMMIVLGFMTVRINRS